MYLQFKYFLQAYCTLSLYEEEMWNVIQEFKKHESDEIKEQLGKELQSIKNEEAWDMVVEWIQKYGNREFSNERAKEWILLLISELQNKKA